MTPWRKRDVRPVSLLRRSVGRPGSRESIIRSIEQGDFSACGGDFYARGHIRSIAAAVGVDPVPLIREYDEEHGPPGAMRASQIFEPATPIKIREPRNLHLGWVLAVAVLALAGFGAYHFYPKSNTSDPAANATVNVHSAHSTPTAKASTTSKPAAREADGARGGHPADRRPGLLGGAEQPPPAIRSTKA